MITIQNTRFNGQKYVDAPHQSRIDKALVSLVRFELGYGGYVRHVDTTEVVTVTQVMAAMDTVTFTGSIAEMRHLVSVAAAHVAINGGATRTTLIEKMSGPIVELANGNALLITHMGPIILGTSMARAALLAGFANNLGFEENQIEAEYSSIADKINKASFEDLISALLLREETGIPLPEILN